MTALKKAPQSLLTQGTTAVEVLVDSRTLFIWSEAQGICSQSVQHWESVRDVPTVAAGEAASPETRKTAAAGGVEQAV